MISPAKSASGHKPTPKVTGPGRPKDLGKRAAILEAAKQLFASEGFAGASMDKIAAEAGVSKLTVYSHFGDKEALFAAAIRAKCEEMMPADLFHLELKGPLRNQLKAIATGFFALVSSEEAISTHRMMLSPGNADDPLRKLFWEAGPKRTQEDFAAFLQARVDAGELEIPDVARATEQFFTLLKGEPHAHAVFGFCCGGPVDSPTEHVAAVVELFLRAYATRR